jgi:type II secretion system protein N
MSIAMVGQRRYLLFILLSIWIVVLMYGVILISFPYEKALRLIFQSIVTRQMMRTDFGGVKPRMMGIEVSKIIVSHEINQGGPILELQKVRLCWHPFALLRGGLDLSSEAHAYGGSVKVEIRDIPFMSGKHPKLLVAFSDISLSEYPGNRFPWFRSLKGILGGLIRKDISEFAPEERRGDYSLRIINGEISQIRLENAPKLTLPFKEMFVGGTIQGSRITVDKFQMNGMGVSISGSGTIRTLNGEQDLDLKFIYRGTAASGPLQGKGTLSVTGDLWYPDIVISPEMK